MNCNAPISETERCDLPANDWAHFCRFDFLGGHSYRSGDHHPFEPNEQALPWNGTHGNKDIKREVKPRS